MSSASGASEAAFVEALVRGAKALDHPLRVRILQSLMVEPGSARTLAEQLGEETKLVTYHLKRLHPYLEMVGSRRGRIKPEHFFRLKEEPLCSSGLLTGSDTPSTGQPGFAVCPLILDEEGRQEVSEGMLKFQRQISDLRSGGPSSLEAPAAGESKAMSLLAYLWIPEPAR